MYGARCRLAYGPADATAIHYLASVKSTLVYLSGTGKGPLNGCACARRILTQGLLSEYLAVMIHCDLLSGRPSVLIAVRKNFCRRRPIYTRIDVRTYVYPPKVKNFVRTKFS